MDLKNKFIDGPWSQSINVTDFVRKNLTSYEGDASFLQGATKRTLGIWNLCLEAIEEERANGGVRSLDPNTVSTISSHKAGYIDKENELIVGLQTDELLKRAIKPYGGIKVVEKAVAENGMEVIDVIEAFTAKLVGIEATDTGNVIKYICRWKEKNGIQDLEKARWYINHLIDHIKKEND